MLHDKAVLFNLWVSKAFYTIIVILNILLSTTRGKLIFRPTIFSFVAILIWTYGMLAHMGYFKYEVGRSEDGNIQYESKIPIVQIGVLRIMQVGYGLLKLKTTNWVPITILIVCDAIYIIFLLMDKGRYYYESECEEE